MFYSNQICSNLTARVSHLLWFTGPTLWLARDSRTSPELTALMYLWSSFWSLDKSSSISLLISSRLSGILLKLTRCNSLFISLPIGPSKLDGPVVPQYPSQASKWCLNVSSFACRRQQRSKSFLCNSLGQQGLTSIQYYIVAVTSHRIAFKLLVLQFSAKFSTKSTASP